MRPDVEKARAIIEASTGRVALGEDDAKQVLTCFGLRVPRRVVIPFGRCVGTALDGLNPPYVLKVVSPSILHKSDVGGVKLGLRDTAEAEAAIEGMTARLCAHAIEGWLLEETVPSGPEMIVGGGIDRRFGPHLMVGLGGVLVELFEDVAFGICPIRRREARRMLNGLRGIRLLRGWRGAQPANEDAVVEAMLAIGGEDGLMMALADVVKELDVNPLIVSTKEAVAVDARIVLRGDDD